MARLHCLLHGSRCMHDMKERSLRYSWYSCIMACDHAESCIAIANSREQRLDKFFRVVRQEAAARQQRLYVRVLFAKVLPVPLLDIPKLRVPALEPHFDRVHKVLRRELAAA